MYSRFKPILSIVTAGCLSMFAFVGCSSDDQQLEDGMQQEEGEMLEQGEEAMGDAMDDLQPSDPMAAMSAEAQSIIEMQQSEPEPIPIPEPQQAPEPPELQQNPQSMGVQANPNRRVYYVASQYAPAQASPDPGAPIVGSYIRGDSIVGLMDGEWANIGPGKWIQKLHLSTRPIARYEPPAVWRQNGYFQKNSQYGH